VQRTPSAGRIKKPGVEARSSACPVVRHPGTGRNIASNLRKHNRADLALHPVQIDGYRLTGTAAADRPTAACWVVMALRQLGGL
jgi:hypothetical protein